MEESRNAPLYMLQFICMGDEELPKEVETRMVGYCRDFFVSYLFLTKHLPNGPMGPLVNSPMSIISDLRAYLYIANDPISEEYSIDTLGFGRSEETNRLEQIRIFVSKSACCSVKMPECSEKDGELDDEQVDTGFRDKCGDCIMSCAVVKYREQLFQIVHNPHISQWVLDNEDGQVTLLDVYTEVELVTT